MAHMALALFVLSVFSICLLISPSGARPVHDAPMGPKAPPGGWRVVMADAFAAPLGSGNGQDPLWHNNRFAGHGYQPGFNNDEVAVFHPSQVKLTKKGLKITAKYQKGVGGPGKNYVSGVIQTNFNPYPGTDGPVSGFEHLGPIPTSSESAPVGFVYTPGPGIGATWAFELVMTSAPNKPVGGNDIGWWSNCAKGPCNPVPHEIDFFEYWGYSDKQLKKTRTGVCVVIYNQNSMDMVPISELYLKKLYDSKRSHRYTHVIYPDMSMSMWVDGKRVRNLGGVPWETYKHRLRTLPWKAWQNQAMPLILSFGLRNPKIDDKKNPVGPPKWKGTRSLTVHSVAVYQDGAHAGKGYEGGGVAPGTQVVRSPKRKPASKKPKSKKH